MLYRSVKYYTLRVNSNHRTRGRGKRNGQYGGGGGGGTYRFQKASPTLT